MMKRAQRYRVRWVVVEGKRTGMFSRLEQYPQLQAQVEASRCPVQEFGAFRIHRLDPEGRCREPNRP
jgi:hypothetical protein